MPEKKIFDLCLLPLRVVALFGFSLALSSCVPVMVGLAVGYVARGEGFGVAPPLDSGRQETDELPAYDNGGDTYDAPVY
jgi:hypothetical protein